MKVKPDTVNADPGEFLKSLDRGRTMHDLEAGLEEVVEGVRTLAKGGTITLKIKVEPASRNNPDQVVVTSKVDVKPPEQDPPATLFFATDRNTLTRHDPRQEEFKDLS